MTKTPTDSNLPTPGAFWASLPVPALLVDMDGVVVEINPATKKIVWSYDSATSNGNQGRPVEVRGTQRCGRLGQGAPERGEGAGLESRPRVRALQAVGQGRVRPQRVAIRTL